MQSCQYNSWGPLFMSVVHVACREKLLEVAANLLADEDSSMFDC